MAGGRVDSDVWVCACASVCLSACLPVYLCTYRYAVVNNLGVTCWIVSRYLNSRMRVVVNEPRRGARSKRWVE